MEILNKIKHWSIALLILMIGWWALAVLINNSFFPTPYSVILTLVNLFASGTILAHILGSLKRTLIGFIIALIVASVLAYSFGTYGILRDYLTPIIELLRPIPPIAWIPLAILWFGIGDTSSSFIIFIAAFFPIFTNLYFGMISVPKVYHRVSKNYRLNAVQKFMHITFPFTLPYLLTGCKTSMGFAWMVVIAAEMVAGNNGLGYFIETNRVLLKTNQVIATMIIIGVLGYAMIYILNYIELKLTAWRY